jgi:TIR domain
MSLVCSEESLVAAHVGVRPDLTLRLGYMQPGDRITVIRKLASSLADMAWADMGLTLRQFEFDTGRIDDEESWYEYAIYQLERGADDQLLELHRHLFPEDAPVLAAETASSEGPWEPGAFRLFITHTHANRARAGALRSTLARWGVDAFVAHDTIEPTKEWQDEIESALRTCDALCVLMTPDLIQSRWCDQEVGFAVARAILVVPLKMGVDPHGFIGKFQALNVREGTSAWSVADSVFAALAKSRLTMEAMAPAVVRRYANSGSFDNTRAAFALLQGIPESAWTPAMIEQVERAAEDNSQVTNANLPGGRPIREAAEELLRAVRGEPSPALADDDIPF